MLYRARKVDPDTRESMKDQSDAIKDMFDTVSLGSPENAVGFVLWRVVHRYQRAIDRALMPLDLTHLQFTTLAMAAWLTKDGKPTSQSAIAQAAEVQPMQISHMVRTLETKGLLQRGRDPQDARAAAVLVTSEGVGRLREAIPAAIEVQQRMFGVDVKLLEMLRHIEETVPS
jgi:DNA-binding MarR family transcriptional regulator